MPLNGGGVRPHHNSSASRVVPAIPYALSSKSRPLQGNFPATPTTNDGSISGQAESNSEPYSANMHPADAQNKTDSSSPSTVANGAENSFAPVKGEALPPKGPERPKSGAETDPPIVQKAIEGQPTISTLPPPFNPVAGSDPPSATSACFYPDSKMQAPPPFQHPHGNAGGLVFGGYRESPSASPNPYINGGHMTQPPPGPYPGPQPTAPPFVPNGHAYHFSDPMVAPAYPPSYGPQPTFSPYPREFGHNHPPPQFPPRPFNVGPSRAPIPLKRGNEASFHPRPMGPAHEPPPQEMPVFAKSTEPKAIHPELMQGHHPGQEQSGPANPPDGRRQWSAEQLGDPSNTVDPDAAVELGLYLHAQFGNYDSADYVVRYSHSANLFPPSEIPCHSLILVKSPKLRSLMTMQDKSSAFQGPQKELNVVISDKYLDDGNAFGKALHRLYAEPLPDLKGFDNNQAAMPERMEFALAFAAAGHFLQYDEIVSHGLEMARQSLSWVTVRNALAFALDGGLSAFWIQRDFSEDRDSSSSFDGTPSKLNSPASAPTYGIYSDRLLENVVQFLIENCPMDLTYSPAAPTYSPGMPPHYESLSGQNRNSRFSHIRFGQMTLDDDSSPATDGAYLSRVLLSLPFPLLKHVLEHQSLTSKLGTSKVAELMVAVVNDRERHRKVAAQNQAKNTGPAYLDETMHEARWSETIEASQQHPSGFKLARYRLGTETPTSAGSNKE